MLNYNSTTYPRLNVVFFGDSEMSNEVTIWITDAVVIFGYSLGKQPVVPPDLNDCGVFLAIEVETTRPFM